ncbi:MAG TPA: 16S rRNA (cytosine(1402)-N(4))-methyltransferase RsmH [Fimbriimonadaceae bacterium]|nr:16S rRNA (cytosine(1402)-N(4))-methyltransferase RsmH [Fimbriimonadaceae bacterium]
MADVEASHEFVHQPVMPDEILEVFALGPGAVVADCTLGLGGHSSKFIDAVRPGGTVLGLDWDEKMLQVARRNLGEPTDVRLVTRHADFRQLRQVLDEEHLQPDAILMDLGLNSAQVDDRERGFSFRDSGPLDMRMDRSKGEPASALLNRLAPHEIENILFEFGDERWARAIAKVIVERRRSQPLRTTQDLVDAVLAAVPPGAREKRIHPATRVFQSIRIAVNRELEGLREAILDAAETLSKGGVIAVLSYHAGEDRIVKTAFRQLAEAGFEEIYRKPLTPTTAEINRNRRSRSAKLRALRRIA